MTSKSKALPSSRRSGAGHPIPLPVEAMGPEREGIPEDRVLPLWRYRGVLLLLLDGVTVSCSFMLAYFLRFEWPSLALRSFPAPEIIPYLQGALLLALSWVFLIWRDRGYESGILGMETFMPKMRTVFISGLYALGLLMAVSFLFRHFLLSRQVYIMTAVLAFGTMSLVRLLFRAIDRDLADQGMVTHRILVAGLSRQSAEFAHLLSSSPSLCRIMGFVRLEEDAEVPGSFEGFSVLGALTGIREIHGRFPFETLVLPKSMEGREESFIEVLNFCESESIALYTLPHHFHIAVDQREVGSFSGIPVLLMRDAAVRPAYQLLKRSMDLFLASFLLVAGLPAWLLIALLIKLLDGGPVLFVQTRAGLHGRPFPMYKFRSMVIGAEEKLGDLVDLKKLEEPVFKIRNDPRVTPLGRFMRRTGLDEIPQLINVLKGEMSFVGPRPEETAVVDLYTHWQRRRLKAVPGITGHQQIHSRGEPSLARRIELDLVYIKHQGLVLDLYILLKTVIVVLCGRGVTH